VRLCVHRKGATRSYPAGHPDLPDRYRKIGQPVLILGDMARYSFLAVGGPKAKGASFGSSCREVLRGRDIRQELEDQGIMTMARGWASLAEKASEAYEDVADAARVSEAAGLLRSVARLRPLGVIKG
jgi:tRNA-splicing ligase RtcB